MKTYTITLFNKRGKKLPEILTIEHEGATGTQFKAHYLNFARLFINSILILKGNYFLTGAKT